MALIDWTQHKTHPLGKRNCRVYSWPLTAGDTYVPLPVGGYQDVTVYFCKGSAFGGSAGFEMSPDPDDATAYVPAVDAHDGSAVSGKSTASAWQLLTRGYFGRPTAGAGVAGVMCWVVLNSSK